MNGFTLIELMIALAISAILIAVSYPAYVSYETTAQRDRTEAALLQLSAKLETYFDDNDSYQGATLQKLQALHLTDNLHYQLQITQATDSHYAIEAIPLDAQAQHDTACGTLSLNDANERKISGDGDVNTCWR